MNSTHQTPPTPIEANPDFDASLLEINLKMSVEDRIRAHDEALEVAREFEKAGIAYRASCINSAKDGA